jgi:hypothetical protein
MIWNVLLIVLKLSCLQFLCNKPCRKLQLVRYDQTADQDSYHQKGEIDFALFCAMADSDVPYAAGRLKSEDKLLPRVVVPKCKMGPGRPKKITNWC